MSGELELRIQAAIRADAVRSREVTVASLVEVEPGTNDPIQAAAVIGRVLEGSGIHLPRVQHGHDAAAWPLLEDAVAHGYDVRIGLEDTLLLPDGTRAPGNADLVTAATRVRAPKGSASRR